MVTKEELQELYNIRMALKEAGYYAVKVSKKIGTGSIKIRAYTYQPEIHDEILKKNMKELQSF